MTEENVYLQQKKAQFETAKEAGQVKENVSWGAIWTEITTGFMLGLSPTQVDVYATFLYSVPQMEIIKMALYAKVPPEKQMQLCKESLSPEDMLHLLFAPPSIPDLSEIEATINQMANKITKQIKKQCSVIEEQLSALETQLSFISDTSQIEPRSESDELTDADCIQTEGEEAENKIGLSEETKEPEEPREPEKPKKPKEPKEPEESKKTEEPAKKKKCRRKCREEPKTFDLGSYIIEAKLSAPQLAIINAAVKGELPDETIKQIIDRRLPAEQMKNVVEVLLTKKYKRETQEGGDRNEQHG